MSSAGVAEAMQNGGSVLHAYGVSYADSVALITAANEPLQDPRKVGNGLKAIAINFAGMNASAKDGSIGLNKTAKALKGIAGIDVYADKKTGQIKNMSTILTELSGKWNGLRQDQKLALSEAVAGKHRANVFQALMLNFEHFKKIQKEFADNKDFGSAEQENAKYVNSIAGKLNKLKETGVSVATTMLDSKLVYGALNGVNLFASGIEKIVKGLSNAKLGLSGMLGLGAGVLGFFRGTGGNLKDFDEDIYSKRKKYFKDKEDLSPKIDTKANKDSIQEEIYTATKKKKPVQEMAQAYKEQTRELEKNTKAHKKGSASLKESYLTNEGNIFQLKKGTELINKDTKARKENISVTNKGTNPIKEFGTGIKNKIDGFKSNILGIKDAFVDGLKGAALSAGTTFLVSAGLELASSAYDTLAHGIANATAKRKEEKQALIQNNQQLDKNISFIKNNADEFNRVKKVYQANKDKPTGWISEQDKSDMQKYLDLSAKIAEINPRLVRGYDKNGNPLVSMTADLKNYAKSLELVKKQNERLIENKNDSIAANNKRLMTQGEIIGESQLEKIKKARAKIDEIYNPQSGSNAKGGIAYDITSSKKGMAQFDKMIASSQSSFKDIQKTWENDYKKYEQDINNGYTNLQVALQKWDQANAFNTQNGLEKLGKSSRFKQFSSEKKAALSEFASTLQWGRLDQTKTINDLFNVGNRADPSKVKKFTEAIKALNEEYSMNKDYKDYTKKVGEQAEAMSKVLGGSKRSWIEKLKDEDRGYSSLFEKQQLEFLKRHGSRPSDEIYGNDYSKYKLSMLQDNFTALKTAQESILSSKSKNDFLNAYDMISKDTSMPKGLAAIARAAYKAKDGTEATGKGMLSLMNSFERFNPKSKEMASNLANFKKYLQDGAKDAKNFSKEIVLPDGSILDKNEAKQLFSGKDLNFINSLLGAFKELEPIAKKVQDYYENMSKKSGEKVSQDAQKAVSDAGLITNEINNLEKAASKLDVSKRDSFRENYAKYFKGSHNEEDGYKKASNDAEALRQSLDDGLINTLAKYSEKAREVKQNTSMMSDTLRDSLKDLNNTDWDKFVRGFDKLGKATKGFANENGIADFNALKNLNKVESMARETIGKKGGLKNEGQIDTVVRIMYNTVGAENLEKAKSILEGIAPEKRVKVMAELAGPNGEALARGLDFALGTGDDKVISKVVQLILSGDYDKIEKITSGEDAKKIVDIKPKSGWEKIKEWFKNLVKPENKDINVNYKENGKPNSNPNPSDKNPTIGGVLNFNRSDLPKAPILPNFNDIRSTVRKKIEIIANDKASGTVGNVLRAILGIPNKKDTNLNAKDNASGTIKTALRVLSGFGGMRTATLAVSAGAALSTIRQAINALAGFGGSKTATINVVKHETTLRDTVFKGFTPKKDSPVPDYINKSIFGKGLISMSLPKNTQINPIATQPNIDVHGGATATALGDMGSVGGYATPSAITTYGDGSSVDTYTAMVEVFKMPEFPAYVYKGVTALGRLKYSATDIKNAFEKDVDVLHDFDRAINRVANSVSLLDKRISRARGSHKYALLNLQDDQLREEKRRIAAKNDTVIKMRDYYKGELKKAGVGFKADGALIDDSYSKIYAWKKKIEEIDKKISEGKGTETKVSKRGKKTTKTVKYSDAEKKKLEEEKKKYENLVKMRDAYEKSVDEVVNNYGKGLDIDNKIAENDDEKHRLKIQAWTENYDAVTRIMDSAVKKITNSLDMLDLRMKYAFGYDRINLMDAQIDKYKEMKLQIDSNNNSLNNLKNNLKSKLSSFGFEFNGDTVSNYQKQINYLKDTSTLFDEIKGLADKYFTLVNEKIPENEKKALEFNNKIRDMSKQKLEDTKLIEEKISNIYKKEIENRNKLIDKEVKRREELIRKRKEEYAQARKEVDYLDTIAEKQKELHKLKMKYESMKFDTSQKGQMEQQKLRDQIEKLQKDLDKTVTRHIDDNVQHSLDEESRRLRDGAEERKEQLKNMFSDSELQKMAQEAIQTGVFKGIDGQVKSLQNALVEYLDEFEGGLSATGSLIEAEIVAKLDTALQTSREMSKVLSELGTIDYNSSGSYIQYDKYRAIAEKNKATNSVVYNSPLLNVNTNSIDSNSVNMLMDEMKKLIDQNNRIIKNNTL